MLIAKNQAGELQISLDGLYPTLVKSVNNRQNKQVKIAYLFAVNSYTSHINCNIAKVSSYLKNKYQKVNNRSILKIRPET